MKHIVRNIQCDYYKFTYVNIPLMSLMCFFFDLKWCHLFALTKLNTQLRPFSWAPAYLNDICYLQHILRLPPPSWVGKCTSQVGQVFRLQLKRIYWIIFFFYFCWTSEFCALRWLILIFFKADMYWSPTDF